MNRLFRSSNDRVIAGVAGGMAEAWDLDPALVRVGWALLILVTGGVFLVLYIVMALVVPLAGTQPTFWATAAPNPGDPASPGPTGYDPSAGPTQTTPPGDPWHYRPHERRADNTAPIVIGLLLVGAGAFFLLRQFIPALNFSLIWPVAVIAVGAVLILAAVVRRGPRQ